MDLFIYEIYLLRRAVAEASALTPDEPPNDADQKVSKPARDAAANREAILAFVAKAGPATVKDVCLRFGLIKVTAHNYLTTLIKQGHIVRKNYGRRAKFCSHEQARAA